MSYLEKLATMGTGRLSLAARKRTRGRMIVYPATVGFRELIRVPDDEKSFRNYYIPFDGSGSSLGRRLRGGVGFFGRLLRVAPVCHEMHLYCLDRTLNASFVMVAAVFARLIGLPVIFHDYGFRHSGEDGRADTRPALFRHVEYGDDTGCRNDEGGIMNASFRYDPVDISRYREFEKKRAVPRVIVYGDLGRPGTISLAARTHEMVKQKYPRTEFFLVSLAEFDPEIVDEIGRSANFYFPRDEMEMQGLFSAADSVMLLSSGGVNRMFLSRARAAGFPVIVNGLEYPDGDRHGGAYLPVARDSYSGLADAVISLVDDEDHYRSFRDFQ
jgi:hypothetical protein